MKLIDFFKKNNIDINEEIGDANSQTLDVNNVDLKIKEQEKVNDIKEDIKMAFKEPKIDSKGFIDLSDVEDADMKAFYKKLNDSRKTELAERKAKDDKVAIDAAISKYASGVKFAEGWSLEDAIKLGDFSKVANDDNLTKSIEDAFTSLKSNKASMFVADKQETAKSNPMLEGFNPQSSVQQNIVPNSFAEAFSAME